MLSDYGALTTVQCKHNFDMNWETKSHLTRLFAMAWHRTHVIAEISLYHLQHCQWLALSPSTHLLKHVPWLSITHRINPWYWSILQSEPCVLSRLPAFYSSPKRLSLPACRPRPQGHYHLLLICQSHDPYSFLTPSSSFVLCYNSTYTT